MKKIRLFIQSILRSRAFLISLLILTALLLLWPFIVSIAIDEYMQFKKVYHWDWSSFFRTLSFLLGIALAAILSLRYIFPTVLYGIRRIATYVSISYVCRRRGYRFKLTRAPFSSLGGIKAKGDIEITADDKIYSLHFIDIPFRFRRVLTVIDGDKYVITRAVAGKIERRGGIPGGRIRGNVGTGQITGLFCNIDYALVKGTDKIRFLPDFNGDTKHEHILMMDVIPVDALIRKNSSFEILSSGEKLDSMTFYYKKGFMRFLKR